MRWCRLFRAGILIAGLAAGAWPDAAAAAPPARSARSLPPQPQADFAAARRAVDEGGAYVNNVKVTDADWKPAADDLLFGRWLVLRRGKKTFAGAMIGS